MVELGANEETLNFPYIFTSARDGHASHDPSVRSGSMQPLLDLVKKEIPPPNDDPNGPLQLLVTSIEWSEFVGSVVIGRISSGRMTAGQNVVVIKEGGNEVEGVISSLEVLRDCVGQVAWLSLEIFFFVRDLKRC